jgi:ribose transport system ATP-binding protein
MGDHVKKGPGLADPVSSRLIVDHASMSFGQHHVLDDVSFKVAPGEIHGLVGQNGSGKSTLVKILAGYHVPEPGCSIQVDGKEVLREESYGPAVAGRVGFRFVHQHLNLIPGLDVIDNVALAGGYQVDGTGRIKWKETQRSVRNWIRDRLGSDLPTAVPVGRLSAVDQVLVAIARALYGTANAKVLVLDEVTRGLPAEEIRVISSLVEPLREDGLAVIFISHVLDEVRTFCDRVSVVRDGHIVLAGNTTDISENQLAEALLGRKLMLAAPRSHEHVREGTGVLIARQLCGGIVRNVNVEVASGEIVGITGGVGSGKSAVGRLLFGAQTRSAGNVNIAINQGAAEIKSPSHALSLGVGYVSEHGSIFPKLTVRENISMTNFAHCWRRGWLSVRAERLWCRKWMVEFDVLPREPERPIEILSGGNKQKATLAQWMRLGLKVLILDEPTQSVDVGAKAQIHALLRQAAANGLAVVLLSSDYQELATLCNRVLVMADGEVASTLEGPAVSESNMEDLIMTSGIEMRRGDAFRGKLVRSALAEL